MGKGAIIMISHKQPLSTRSSTTAELVGANDITGAMLWIRKFLEAQGYNIKHAIIHDNQSAMLSENN